MDHAKARKMNAVERYILGDLPAADAEEFEQHFFGCVECSSDLHAAASLAENARSIFASGAPVAAPKPPRRWADSLAAFFRPPLAASAAFAALALVALVGYQNSVTIPALRRQAALASSVQSPVSFVLRAAARGDDAAYTVPASAPFFILRFDPAWDQPASILRCRLQPSSGAPAISLTTGAPEAGKPVNLICPTSLVGSGKWLLTVEDSSSGAELARYSFTVRLQ